MAPPPNEKRRDISAAPSSNPSQCSQPVAIFDLDADARKAERRLALAEARLNLLGATVTPLRGGFLVTAGGFSRHFADGDALADFARSLVRKQP
jgi:hypothetical protein